MFCCIVEVRTGIFMRSSWWTTLADAVNHASSYPGIIAVEEIGKGWVWRQG